METITFFGITHIQWLKQHLVLPNGIPSADTILRVLARAGHTKFEKCFLDWTSGYFRERVQPGYGIAIDGKTARGSATDTEKGIHLVSAWANELSIALGQVKTAEKSNEITAIPQLLSALDVAGRQVSNRELGI